MLVISWRLEPSQPLIILSGLIPTMKIREQCKGNPICDQQGLGGGTGRCSKVLFCLLAQEVSPQRTMSMNQFLPQLFADGVDPGLTTGNDAADLLHHFGVESNSLRLPFVHICPTTSTLCFIAGHWFLLLHPECHVIMKLMSFLCG